VDFYLPAEVEEFRKMPTSITAGCASCGTDIETEIDEDGTVDACFGNTIIADEELVYDDAEGVGEHLDRPIPEGHIAIVYAECPDCCPNCSTSKTATPA
jgi:hypothetical protein